MITQRFNIDWNSNEPNGHWFGLFDLIKFIADKKSEDIESWPPPKMKMLEIGSYMGESTMMFGSSQLFYEIHCIEPFQGYEKFNLISKYDWNFVEEQFKINTRFFNNITLHKNYSYNMDDKFSDEYFDFIYIDASHKYEDVKRDLTLYLPKLKKDGIIAGHDYHTTQWPGVVQAVNETVGVPRHDFWDTSWLTYDI